MSDILIRNGKAVGFEKNSAAVPLGVEYEKLMKDLKTNVEKRYEQKDLRNHIQDNRKHKQFLLDNIKNDSSADDKKTFVMTTMPVGQGSPNNGFDEPNPKPAYPLAGDIPYGQGLIWSD